MKLKAKGISDGNKANPNIRHKYVIDFAVESDDKDDKGNPIIIINRDLPEKDQVFVICDHLLSSEREKYLSARADGHGYADFASIVRDKVISLHNLDHPTLERELTIDELLNSFGSPMARSIFQDISMHLMTASEITEEETKN